MPACREASARDDAFEGGIRLTGARWTPQAQRGGAVAPRANLERRHRTKPLSMRWTRRGAWWRSTTACPRRAADQ